MEEEKLLGDFISIMMRDVTGGGGWHVLCPGNTSISKIVVVTFQL